jgi:dihydrofolate synthase / folylpolyglutamate synthase
MTYEEALAFWYGRIDYERRQPRPGDLKLDRMRALLRRLGDPHRRVRSVHVAGTKGKGSTSALLASVLGAAGHRTGLFTSPHLSDISERVQVNGVPITRAEIAARMTEVAAAVAELDAEGDPTRAPTFFEVITALGFLHFDCRRVDVAVLEVGLGGRFDSTNVCEPLLSVITNISYDHMGLLGHTIPEVAYQKAGIIKRGVPVVTTADDPEALEVIDRVAAQSRAPLTVIGRDMGWVREPAGPFEAGPLWVTTDRQDWSGLPLALHGDHQGANAAGVVAAVERLREAGLTIRDGAVYTGFRDVVWPARMELMCRRPVVVLDCAHNVASAEALVQTMLASFPVAGRRHLIFASSTDKQIAEMLEVLAPHFDHFHLTRYQSNPRSADPASVAEMLRALGRPRIQTHETPEHAWRTAWSEVRSADGIVIAGSVFLAGELRPVMVHDCRPHGRSEPEA